MTAKRGRPRLGNKSDRGGFHNVFLLGSQWRWLLRQAGGASATLRDLVARAMRREKD